MARVASQGEPNCATRSSLRLAWPFETARVSDSKHSGRSSERCSGSTGAGLHDGFACGDSAVMRSVTESRVGRSTTLSMVRPAWLILMLITSWE